MKAVYIVTFVIACILFAVSAAKVHKLGLKQLPSQHNPFSTSMMTRSYLVDPLTQTPVPIHNFFNAQYYIEIKVGSERTLFSVIADTGSSNLWIPVNCDDTCGSHPQLDPSKSTTYRSDPREFVLHYGSGDATGYVMYDDVEFGEGLLIKGQGGGAVNHTALGPAYSLAKFDGILGMGFQPLSIYNITTPFQSLLEQRLIDVPVFAFYLTNDPEQVGELTLGGYNPDYIAPGAELQWVKLKSKTYWEMKMDFDVGGQHFELSAQRGILDSGTSLIAMPTEDLKRLAPLLKAEPFFLQPREYLVDCKEVPTLPNISFNVGDQRLPLVLTPKQYVMEMAAARSIESIGYENLKEDAICLLSILALDK